MVMKDQKIKVLQLIWQLSTGGGEKVAINIQEFFTGDDEIETRMCSFTPFCERPLELYAQEHSLDVRYINEYKGGELPGLVKKVYLHFTKTKQKEKWLKKQIEEFQPDIIHVHLSNLAYELFGILQEYSKKCFIFYHMHSMPEAVKTERRKVIKKALEKGVYYPIGVTKQQIESAQKVYAYDKPIPLIYNGIDENKFISNEYRNDLIKQEELREMFGLHKNDYIIGSVGRLHPIKNYRLLVEAFCEIKKQLSDAKLMIVGYDQANMKQELLKLAGEYKNDIVFTGNQSETYKFYSIMNVFALASFFESSSIVSVEAQLSGVPCVLSEAISDETIISDAVIKVSPNATKDEWASAIIKMREKKAQLFDSDRFNLKINMNKLKSVYKEFKRKG